MIVINHFVFKDKEVSHFFADQLAHLYNEDTYASQRCCRVNKTG